MNLEIVLHVFAWLLRLYPSRFREAFAEEMWAVFEHTAAQASARGRLPLTEVLLRELLQAPAALWRAHGLSRSRALSPLASGLPPNANESLPPLPPDGRDSRWQAGLEAGLFLALGAALVVLTYILPDWPGAGWRRAVDSLGWLSAGLCFGGVLLGLAHGWPRWAYPFAGLLLGCTYLGASLANFTPFFDVLAVAALTLAGAAALVNSRVQPLPLALQILGRSLRHDWSRLSFGTYGVAPLLIAVAFEDARYHYRTPYLALSVVCMVAGALVYVRSRRPLIQMLALLLGLSLAFWMAAPDKAYYDGRLSVWLSPAGAGLADVTWMAKLWLGVTALMLAPLAMRWAQFQGVSKP